MAQPTKIMNEDFGGDQSLNARKKKTSLKFKYDQDADKVLMIKKQLENSEDLRRVTCGSDNFQQITNREFNVKVKQELE